MPVVASVIDVPLQIIVSGIETTVGSWFTFTVTEAVLLQPKLSTAVTIYVVCVVGYTSGFAEPPLTIGLPDQLNVLAGLALAESFSVSRLHTAVSVVSKVITGLPGMYTLCVTLSVQPLLFVTVNCTVRKPGV